MGKLFVWIFLVFISCTSEYEKGESHFKYRNYEIAKSHYKLVKSQNKHFKHAQHRLAQIDSIALEEKYLKALRAYKDGEYHKVDFFLSGIPETNHNFNNSKILLAKTDSMYIVLRLKDDEAIKHIQKRGKYLFNALMEFKDKRDFHEYGFAINYKYNAWMKEVDALRSAPESGYFNGAIDFLVMLGLDYLGSKGEETDYSRKFKESTWEDLNNPSERNLDALFKR